MDIFMRGLPSSCGERDLKSFLNPKFEVLGIQPHQFYLKKMRNKGCATITVTLHQRAEAFLTRHGFLQDPTPGQKPRDQLYFHHKPLICYPSKNPPTEFELRALEYEEERQISRQLLKKNPQPNSAGAGSRFRCHATSCGQWTYRGLRPRYVPRYTDSRPGEVLFGRSTAAILLHAANDIHEFCRVTIPYYIVESVVLAPPNSAPTLTFTLNCPPRFYSIDGLAEALAVMNIDGRNAHTDNKRPERTRTSSLAPAHAECVGSCFVYQITLVNPAELSSVVRVLDSSPAMPAHVRLPTPTVILPQTFKADMDSLLTALRSQQLAGAMPFTVKFQLQRLATNGFLAPPTVRFLIPFVNALLVNNRASTVAECIRRLSNEIEFAGPEVEGKQFEVNELAERLRRVIETFYTDGSMYEVQRRHSYLALVHRVTVTPCGIYLEGPEAEVSNRVLRKYRDFGDHFIRVTFADEDGDRLGYEVGVSNGYIYHERFKTVLLNGINIAGYQFVFLGFSHSSLRSQTCWFSSPFVQDGTLFHAQHIIKGLGDFSKIRSPAKCAARIGQAFTNTSGTVRISKHSVDAMLDVERNGRVFSDGCGTISPSLLERIWDSWALSHGSRPNVVQIRFAGAKGMVSLDSRLQDDKLILRQSMMKYPGSPSLDIELCSGNFRPLPMYLNRQFVKILEDLGVKPEVLLRLQRRRVEQLRLMSANPPNAAKLLEINRIGGASRLPQLIRYLHDIGLSFQEDGFLRSVVEIASLAQLRELKYRARIPVDRGQTLLGIMDETGFLKEGEIYAVIVDKDGRRKVITGDPVLITRAPALHPGDIQVCRAINVPSDSILNNLNNCIVFSQHGDRDLPSQLSGGDLDGDLYNIIWDWDLLPTKTFEPADYPRAEQVDIGREITREDICDFFITFMETDQLGRISNLHLAKADREVEGTLHEDCIKLAELASIAVDFSKTGIPVDLRQIPRYDLIRPDFMAPGPRVTIEGEEAVLQDDPEPLEDDVIAALEPDTRRTRYYKSTKVLGRLFRDIDERDFLNTLQAQGRRPNQTSKRQTLLQKVLNYVRKEAAVLQWQQYKPIARRLRETYEYNLSNTMFTYSASHSDPLSEAEVFSGSMLGKSPGAQSKRIREANETMKEDFDRYVKYAIDSIKMDDDNGGTDEALPRAIACLAVGIEEEGTRFRSVGNLKSWGYISTVVCLEELMKFSGGPLRTGFVRDY